MELILSLLTGGATGILGSLLGRVTGFFEKAQAQKFRQEEWGHERALIEMQMRGRQGEWEHERAIAEADAAARMREASYAHDSATGRGSQWVVNVLRLVRPALTLALIALTAAFWFSLDLDTTADGESLRGRIVAATLYLATAAVTWWFGDRARR